MHRHDFEQLIHEIFRARKDGNLDALLGHLAPDVTLRFPGSSGNATLTRSSGSKDEVRTHLAALIHEWQWQGIDVLSTVLEGDRAVVHARQHVLHTPTGTQHATEVVDLITLRDGKVSEFVEFVDTAAVAALQRGE